MGFFNEASAQAVPGGNFTKPLIIAAGALILHHYFGRSGPDAKIAPAPAPVPAQPGTAVPDGSIIGGLGGLIEKFSRAGLGPIVDSWVGSGPNRPVSPGQLGSAIDQPTLKDIAAKAGMSEQELLSQLSRALPGLVDKLTPQGRMPTLEEITRGYGR